jgi:hypothetical protein
MTSIGEASREIMEAACCVYSDRKEEVRILYVHPPTLPVDSHIECEGTDAVHEGHRGAGCSKGLPDTCESLIQTHPAAHARLND